MKIETLNKETWAEISKSQHLENGYLGEFITLDEPPHTDLLIFRDETGKKHFVVELKNSLKQDIRDPNINGLILSIRQFKFNGKGIKSFINLECSLDDYTYEFTEIIKEISIKILVNNANPLECVNDVVENWKAFWSSRVKEVLSEEEQIGLICELMVLRQLCQINPVLALNSWRGPFGEKNDFIFSDWVFEIKGTRRNEHIHLINGINQLNPPQGKNLAFISFVVAQVETQTSMSVQFLIDSIIQEFLKSKPALIELFHKLLIASGYSKVFSDQYRIFQFDIISDKLFIVDENFPALTSKDLNRPLNFRVSEIRYKIDLNGLDGKSFNSIQLSSFFY